VKLSELIALIEKALGRPAIIDRQPLQPAMCQSHCGYSRRAKWISSAVKVENGIRFLLIGSEKQAVISTVQAHDHI